MNDVYIVSHLAYDNTNIICSTQKEAISAIIKYARKSNTSVLAWSYRKVQKNKPFSGIICSNRGINTYELCKYLPMKNLTNLSIYELLCHHLPSDITLGSVERIIIQYILDFNTKENININNSKLYNIRKYIQCGNTFMTIMSVATLFYNIYFYKIKLVGSHYVCREEVYNEKNKCFYSYDPMTKFTSYTFGEHKIHLDISEFNSDHHYESGGSDNDYDNNSDIISESDK